MDAKKGWHFLRFWYHVAAMGRLKSPQHIPSKSSQPCPWTNNKKQWQFWLTCLTAYQTRWFNSLMLSLLLLRIREEPLRHVPIIASYYISIYRKTMIDIQSVNSIIFFWINIIHRWKGTPNKNWFSQKVRNIVCLLWTYLWGHSLHSLFFYAKRNTSTKTEKPLFTSLSPDTNRSCMRHQAQGRNHSCRCTAIYLYKHADTY